MCSTPRVKKLANADEVPAVEVAGVDSDPAELPEPLLGTLQQALRVREEHAVLEAEMDVAALRPDPGEVPDPLTLR